jgi:hypothetical protein
MKKSILTGNRKWYFSIGLIALMIGLLSLAPQKTQTAKFITIQGQNLIGPDGKPFLIKGINLGNWINPEGYMFLFNNVNSFRTIDQALKELAGPDATNKFWRSFQENYITQADIRYIKQTGMNSIRLPFHYKLFTNEDYMGTNDASRGFELIDKVISWCKAEGIYVILDMHDAPGGQTGDNIDDSYGYPWLYENESDMHLFCSIWKRIAAHYANETTVLGYDLLNEPIAPYFSNKDELNAKLEPTYKKAVAAIRQVDKNHIVMLGGAQWDGNFDVFTDWKFDNKMMYTCHRYWCDTLQANIKDFLAFRNKVNLPLYMGETGENTDQWVGGFRRLLEANNIGWHYWPYKKMGRASCMVSVKEPAEWNQIIEYTKKDRSSFEKIRTAKPSPEVIAKAMNELLENIKFENCKVNKSYITALGMKP